MRTVRLLATVTALLFVAMALYTSPLEPSIPALQFTFTEAAFKALLEQWQPADITRFKYHFAIEFPFVLCYGLLGFMIATRTRLFQPFPYSARSLLAWSLPGAAAADAIENLLHWHLVLGHGPFASWLYLVAGIIASSKWLFIAIFIGCAAYARCQRVG